LSIKQERVERDLIDFKRLLTRAVTDLPEFSTLVGDGTLHEMFYNWVRPKSVIESLASTKYPNLADGTAKV